MLENTKGTIKNGQFSETGNIGYTRRRKTKQKHNTICVGHHSTQTNTNNMELRRHTSGLCKKLKTWVTGTPPKNCGWKWCIEIQHDIGTDWSL
jgi:hypothetical protein